MRRAMAERVDESLEQGRRGWWGERSVADGPTERSIRRKMIKEPSILSQKDP